MKTILTLCAAMLLFAQAPLRAQVPVATPEEEVVTMPDVMPSFKGGEIYHFRAWFNDQVVYPRKTTGKGINADVEVSFIIEKNGKLTGIDILESADELFSKEAIRVLKKSPRWTPGTVNGKDVRVRLTLPIYFLYPNERQFISLKGEKIDVAPEFMGGDLSAFNIWVSRQVRLPNISQETRRLEMSALLAFVIDETGRVTNVTVISANDYSFSENVAGIVKRSPDWTPALIDGNPVSVVCTFPVSIVYTADIRIVSSPSTGQYKR